MFRRTKTDHAANTSEVKEGGKGRATPTRKEAEAAAKARAKAPRTRKEMAAAQREGRLDSSQKMRAAMKGGDPRYLPARDRGPVKAFIRDMVDARFSFVELMIPLMILTLVLGYSGNDAAARIGNSILLGTLLLVAVEMVMLRLRLRRELRRRFPNEPTKGTTYYALMRALQMRFMRLPKSRVKIGQDLPETYR
ncbi:DUF3043 domain-containing protein [Nocardioides sp.]|uniref:DUF3043 domain-containing protein n=1 Tax=Nocardioides sp. TaxID=35761 RepID=UPI003D107F02